MCKKNKPTLQFIIDDMYVGNKPCVDFDILSDKILLDSVVGLANNFCMTLDGCCTSSVLVHLTDLERIVSTTAACNNFEEELREYLECDDSVCCNSLDNDNTGGNTNGSDENSGCDNNGGGNSGGGDDNGENCKKLQKAIDQAQKKISNASDNLNKANAQVEKGRQTLATAQKALTADPTNKQKQNAVTNANKALTKDLATQSQAQSAYNAALTVLTTAQKTFNDAGCNN